MVIFIPPYVVWQYTKFTVPFFFLFMYGYGFLNRGFADRGEILHGGLATSQTGPILGDSPRDGRILGVNRVGYASCWSTCYK